MVYILLLLEKYMQFVWRAEMIIKLLKYMKKYLWAHLMNEIDNKSIKRRYLQFLSKSKQYQLVMDNVHDQVIREFSGQKEGSMVDSPAMLSHPLPADTQSLSRVANYNYSSEKVLCHYTCLPMCLPLSYRVIFNLILHA